MEAIGSFLPQVYHIRARRTPVAPSGEKCYNGAVKILHIIPSLHIGGTEKMLAELCRGLKDRGFEFRVAALKGGGAAEETLRRMGVPVDLLESPGGLIGGTLDLPRIFGKLRRLCAEFGPRVVHTWLTRANVIGRLAARSAGVPAVISSLRVMEEEKSFHLWAERLTARGCDVVTVNSRALEVFARERIGLPAEKIVLIPNGIDASVRPDAEAARKMRALWAPQGQFLIGALGRLHRQKGMDILLKAAARTLKERPDCRFIVAGDGPEKEDLIAQARSLGIESQVLFAGWVSNSLDYLGALDLFAFPSRWEGMPNAVLEAMLAEKPVVCTPAGGTADLIEDQHEGLVVRIDDPEALAAAMERLIAAPDLRRRLAHAAREKVLNQFSLEGMILSHEKLYRRFEN